jgi:hypothetical protein
VVAVPAAVWVCVVLVTRGWTVLVLLDLGAPSSLVLSLLCSSFELLNTGLC